MENQIKDFILIFTSILYEAMPFIVLGSVIAGILEVMIPQRFIARIMPKSPILASAIGGLLGLIFPMCECGIIPVMRRLLRKGVPLSACVAYLLAGPIVNVVVMGSTGVAFSDFQERRVGTGDGVFRHFGGVEMMSLRCIMGYLVAFGTSLVVERTFRKYGTSLLMPLAIPPSQPGAANLDQDGPKPNWFQKIGMVTETALHDFVDITVFLILGALLAALTRTLVTTDQIEFWSRDYPFFSNAIMMLLAIVLCLCSEADAFVAASFATLWPSAKLAFLVLGPMVDLKLYMMYTSVFRPRLIWTIFGSVIIQVWIYSTALYFFLKYFGPSVLGTPK